MLEQEKATSLRDKLPAARKAAKITLSRHIFQMLLRYMRFQVKGNLALLLLALTNCGLLAHRMQPPNGKRQFK